MQNSNNAAGAPDERASPTCTGESPDGTVTTQSSPNSFSNWARIAGLMKKQYLLVVIMSK